MVVEGNDVTEAEWLAARRPNRMFAYLHEKATDRKKHLFACARCRRHWPLLADPRSQRAIEVVESFADGRTSARGLKEPRRAARAAGELVRSERAAAEAALRGEGRDARPERAVSWGLEQEALALGEREAAAWLAWRLVGGRWDSEEAALQTAEFAAEVAGRRGEETAERAAQCDFLRDLFGNPFRRPSILPEWLTWNYATIVRLARAAYDQRQLPAGKLDNGLLVVLADALEEAGCSGEDILGHLRGPGPHVRGCWPVDLVRSVD
jgi:hypothetical protein